MIDIVIDETASSSPRTMEQSAGYNQVVIPCINWKQVVEELEERYGKVPKIKSTNLIYRDLPGKEAEQVGFMYSYWNKDWSHNSKSWWQTDWISFYEYEKREIPVCEIKRHFKEAKEEQKKEEQDD